jgi:hypothetical protein
MLGVLRRGSQRARQRRKLTACMPCDDSFRRDTSPSTVRYAVPASRINISSKEKSGCRRSPLSKYHL